MVPCSNTSTCTLSYLSRAWFRECCSTQHLEGSRAQAEAEQAVLSKKDWKRTGNAAAARSVCFLACACIVYDDASRPRMADTRHSQKSPLQRHLSSLSEAFTSFAVWNFEASTDQVSDFHGLSCQRRDEDCSPYFLPRQISGPKHILKNVPVTCSIFLPLLILSRTALM